MLTDYEARQNYREIWSWSGMLAGLEPTECQETFVLRNVFAVAGDERVMTNVRIVCNTDRGATDCTLQFDQVPKAWREAAFKAFTAFGFDGVQHWPAGCPLVIEEMRDAKSDVEALYMALGFGPELLPEQVTRCEIDPALHLLRDVGPIALDGLTVRLMGIGLRQMIPWPVADET